jgi:spore coat polysaccharide biosynthesis protein SpsF
MIGAVIFARISSTRLPAKVIFEIQGKTILEHIIERVRRSKYITKIVVATTTNSEDDMIEEICHRSRIDSFRGADRDVVDRCYQAAKEFNLDPLTRVTGDDPFKDAGIIDHAIELYLDSDYDLVCNTLNPSFPEGLDVEVISFDAITRIWRESSNESDREHLTKYVFDNLNLFRILNFQNQVDLSNIRLTLDTKEDLDLVKLIYDALYSQKKCFTWNDVLNYLQANPDILKINNSIKRSDRYKHSLIRE